MYNAYLEFKQQYEPHPSWFAPGVVLSPPLQDVEPDQQTEPCSGPQQYHLSKTGSWEQTLGAIQSKERPFGHLHLVAFVEKTY